MTQLRPFLLLITMPDGSQGRHVGHYTSGCTAVCVALIAFPSACRVSARRLP